MNKLSWGSVLTGGDARRPEDRRPAAALAAAAAAMALVSVVLPAVTGGQDAAATPPVDKPAVQETTPAPVPSSASGTTRVLAVPGTDSTTNGRAVRYTVEVEDGAGVDEGEFAGTVRTVLTDARGWETQDQVHFVNISPEQVAAGEKPDVRITLASPKTVDRMCAPMDTAGEVSCRNGERVALNALRWTQGVPYYPSDLKNYRIYMVNHEVGHFIGHQHEPCSGPGKPAPVMLQQTLGLQGCTRYPWAVPGKTL